MAFYGRGQLAPQMWAAAPPDWIGRVMPRAERIVQEMYDWYEARVDDEELHGVFRHLQKKQK